MTHTIIRAARRSRFVVLDQDAVEDTRLSWAARGLLGYLLSRPDDWKVLVGDLRRRGDLGRDGVYKLLRELRAAGYVHYQRVRDSEGRMRGGIYFVCEEPATPHPDLPDTAEPDTARPSTVKPEALPKTDPDPIPTTTTRPTTTKGAARECDTRACVQFPPWVSEDLRVPGARIVADLSPDEGQLVVDEWIGSMTAGAIRRSPLGYLRALVKNLDRGDFTPRYSATVATTRDRPR